MATEVIMPKAGMAMEEGTVVKWLKQVGEPVAQGEILLEILTDKVNMEVEAEVSGTLLKIMAQEGDVIPVLTPIAYIGEAGEKLPDIQDFGKTENQEANTSQLENDLQSKKETTTHKTEISPVSSENQQDQETEFTGKIRATPAARQEARNKGVDLKDIKGSGPKGRVQKMDVLSYEKVRVSPLADKIARDQGISLDAVEGSGDRGKIMADDVRGAGQKSALNQRISKEDVLVPMSPMRRVISRRMSESYFTAPVFSLEIKVDMQEAKGALKVLREEIQEQMGVKLTLNDLIIKATAKALMKYPQLNSSLEGDVIRQHGQVHMAVAVGLEEGLVVPVIKNADSISLGEIALSSKDIASRGAQGKLKPEEMEGSTFTISNLGMYDIKYFTSIINQPNSAILGVGTMKDQVVAIDGQVEIRPMMSLILTIDHRVVDGAKGAMFLQEIKRLLQNPMLILV